MRPVRGFIILFTIFLRLACALPIQAADSYFSIPDCTDDLTKPCLTTGDGVNTIVPLNPTEVRTAQTIDQLLGKNIVTNWLGKLKPLGSYLIGNEKLDTFANQVQTASDTDLNPASLQSIEQHDETPKPFSMTSRECVYDPETGELKGDFVSSTTMITDDVPWLRPAVEGSRRLSSFTTRYVQESQDYRLQNITIKQDAALPCGSNMSGETKTQNPSSYQFDNTYGSATGNSLAQVIFTITANMIKLFTHDDGTTTAEATITIPSNIVGTGQNPFAGHGAALLAGCATSSDLSAVTYATDEQKQKLCETGGFVNSMYRPEAIDATYKSDLNASDPTQQWEQTVTGGKPIAANSNAFAARIEAAGTYTNCTLMPADYQNTAVPDGECNTNWVKAASTGCNAALSDEAVNQAIANAEKIYGIPEGMLRAIYEIEALDLGIVNPNDYVCKRNKDIPGHIAGDTSAGLMQLNDGAYASVTCGKGMKDDVAECSQKQDGQLSRCDINDTFELAARLLLLKVGKWGNTACKPTGSITTNSEIYTAACRYGTGFTPTSLTIQYGYNLPRPKRSNGAMNYCDIVCNKMGRCGPFYPPQVDFPPNW